MNLAGGLGIALFILGLALALAVNEVREGDRRQAKLEFGIDLANAKAEWKTEKQIEIAAIHETHNGEQATIVKEKNDAISRLDMHMVNASFEARNKPIGFGDDMLRDLIYYDCLFALGKSANQPGSRSDCGREASMAASTGAGLPITVITQDFLAGWAAACDDQNGWGRVGRMIGAETEEEQEIRYTREMWENEFPGFDPDMCRETVVAFTPEASFMFRKMFVNADGYIDGMVGLAHSQEDIIDQLSN